MVYHPLYEGWHRHRIDGYHLWRFLITRTSKLLFILSAIVLCITAQARERGLFLGDSITPTGHYVDYIETWFLLNDADALEIINSDLIPITKTF